MLSRLLKSIGKPSPAQTQPAADRAGPEMERERWLDAAHARVPVELHRRIQFGGLTVAGLDFLTLVDGCLRDSHTGVRPLKAFHRYQAALHLARYFAHTIDVPGERVECGVFTGTMSLLMCRLARARRPAFDGTGFHMVDSFAGLSRPGPEDALEFRENPDGGALGVFGYGQGAMAAPIEKARHSMREFPGVRMHQGWIPAVLASLPDAPFAFVHIDVDLYEPTLACLEHFHPRLAAGGAIVCDDYGAPRFPGAARAWDEYCARRDVPFVVLDTGQSVILRDAAPA